MKKTLYLFCIVATPVFAQSPAELISKVIRAQQKLKAVHYTLHRTDTLVTGDVRTMNGSADMAPAPADPVLGYLFSGKLDGETTERIYDGHLGYVLNPVQKSYSSTANKSQISYLLYGGGGWLIMPDLVKIDTSKNIALSLTMDKKSSGLKISYADYKPEDVSNRYKIIYIDKKTSLPAAVRIHQETLGKVQDLYFEIKSIQINPSLAYDFTLPQLKDYQREVPKDAAPAPVFSLKDKAAPAFTLSDFDGKPVSLTEATAKVTLLDLWEVWCGPCVESMPKVQKLYDTYHDQGLQVFGIINDTRQLDAAKLMVSKKRLSFPMLTGNTQLKKDYKLDGSVPLYILIDITGRISFISQGYSAEIESAIRAALK